MRIAACLLLVVLAAGCATPAPPPATWAFRDALNVPKKATCDTSTSREDPVLGTVNAFGLEPHMNWLPGHPPKINWEPQPLTPSEMDVELRRPGAATVAYRVHKAAEPSSMAFPEPGCWDVTVRTTAKSGTTRVYFEPARPVGILVAKGNDPYDAELTVFNWQDQAIGLPLLDAAAAKSDAPAQRRKSAQLWLVWQAPDLFKSSYQQLGRTLTPLVYVPASEGQGAQVIMAKSLLTGDCRDANKPVAAAIKPELASEIEKQLGNHWLLDESEKNPWRLYATDCTRFEQPKER